MADFTHESNYTEETSFSKVVFGSSAPVLEVELNELQEITDTKIKRIHDVIGKCIYVRGAITPNNISGSIWNVKVTDCILIFNGVSVYIDSITSPNATVTGGNVYFTVFKSKVTGSTSLKKYGNYTNGTSIENPIYDSRIGGETSQRVQVKVGLSISSSATPDDTSTDLYFQLGTIFSGHFVQDTRVLNKTILGSIINKLNASDFTTNNITGTLSIAKGGTGATNKSDALANLVYNTVPSFGSTDLNSYTTQAINCFTSTVPAVSNIPTGSSGVGMLAVVTSDRTDLYQVWFEMSSGKTDTYMRTKIGNTWSSWGKAYNTNDDTGYVNPSLAGVGSEVSNCFVSKKAGFVNVTGYVRAVPTSTTASTVNVATLPQGYQPTRDAVTSFCVNESVSPNTLHVVQVTTNGNINIRNVVKTTAANQVFRLNITYPADF